MIAFGSHGIVLLFIYALVIPTRLLAKSENDVLTLLVTGLVFPGCAFLTRKVTAKVIYKFIMADLTGTQEEKIQFYSNWMKFMSSFIMFMPTVLLYLNTTPKFALISALGQLATEILGKAWIVWATKRSFDDVLAAVINEARNRANGRLARVAVLASQEPGSREDVDSAASTLSGARVLSEDGSESEEAAVARNMEKRAKRLKYALAMMAVRFQGELVAEKGSIVSAAIAALLYLRDLVDATPSQLAGIAVIFFVVESIADVILVYLLHNFFEVPMLSAIPSVNVLSKDNLVGGATAGLGFTIMSVCIGMAAMLPL